VCFEGVCVAERAVQSVGLSAQHTCAADLLQTLWCWGRRPDEPAAPVRLLPTLIAPGGWNQVAAAGSAESLHSCAIHKEGSLWCWGNNERGQLGPLVETAEAKTPERATTGTWLDVASAEGVSCGVRVDGTLWCWGAATWLVPDVTAGIGQIGSKGGYSSVSLGSAFGCALRDGLPYCWGDNSQGQLGSASASMATEPAAVTVAEPFASVVAGAEHACGIDVAGALWCWGKNDVGQLGVDSDEPSSPTPVRVGAEQSWLDVAAGDRHTCAIRGDHTIWCWGSSDEGQAGQLAPVVREPARVDEGADWNKIVSGARHVCAIAANGSLWCWGAGEEGQLGSGTAKNSSIPVEVVLRTE
jgi:alpha-tubulin suppressor-like RCC1 family protein